jgi:hypothetical protein
MAQKRTMVDFIADVFKDDNKVEELKNVGTPDELVDFFTRENIDEIPTSKECKRIVKAINDFKEYMAEQDPDDLVRY